MSNEETKQTSIYLSKEEIRDLKKIAADYDISFTNLVRKQIQKLIEEEEYKYDKEKKKQE